MAKGAVYHHFATKEAIFEAVEMLMRRNGRVVTKTSIDEGLYAFGEEVESNTIEVYVYRLRKRLQESHAGVVIHTVRGVGYLLKASQA